MLCPLPAGPRAVLWPVFSALREIPSRRRRILPSPATASVPWRSKAPRFANLQVPRLNPHLAFKLDPRTWVNHRGTDQALYNASAAHARTLANTAAAYNALSRGRSRSPAWTLTSPSARFAMPSHLLGELTRTRRDAVARAINCPADIMRLVHCAMADDGHLDLIDAAQILPISRKTQAFTDAVTAVAATRPAAKRKPDSGRAEKDKSYKKARAMEPRASRP